MIRNFYRYLLQLSIVRLFLLLFFCTYLTRILVGIILEHFFGLSPTVINNESDLLAQIGEFFSVVIVVPFIETAIFQKIILDNSKPRIKNNILCVALSAVVFGLSHMTGLAQIVLATFSGFYLGFFYTIARQKKYNAFWLTCLMHALWNLIVYIVRYYML
nr:CPBP family intramembrane glutamic endopeptidase [uncultured Flavobacterium sp.]